MHYLLRTSPRPCCCFCYVSPANGGYSGGYIRRWVCSSKAYVAGLRSTLARFLHRESPSTPPLTYRVPVPASVVVFVTARRCLTVFCVVSCYGSPAIGGYNLAVAKGAGYAARRRPEETFEGAICGRGGGGRGRRSEGVFSGAELLLRRQAAAQAYQAPLFGC